LTDLGHRVRQLQKWVAFSSEHGISSNGFARNSFGMIDEDTDDVFSTVDYKLMKKALRRITDDALIRKLRDNGIVWLMAPAKADPQIVLDDTGTSVYVDANTLISLSMRLITTSMS